MTNSPKILSKDLFARNRFALTSMLTRFGDVEWFVADAEIVGTDGLPEIVYQGDEAGGRAFVAVEEDRVLVQDMEAEQCWQV